LLKKEDIFKNGELVYHEYPFVTIKGDEDDLLILLEPRETSDPFPFSRSVTNPKEMIGYVESIIRRARTVADLDYTPLAVKSKLLALVSIFDTMVEPEPPKVLDRLSNEVIKKNIYLYGRKRIYNSLLRFAQLNAEEEEKEVKKYVSYATTSRTVFDAAVDEVKAPLASRSDSLIIKKGNDYLYETTETLAGQVIELVKTARNSATLDDFNKMKSSIGEILRGIVEEGRIRNINTGLINGLEEASKSMSSRSDIVKYFIQTTMEKNITVFYYKDKRTTALLLSEYLAKQTPFLTHADKMFFDANVGADITAGTAYYDGKSELAFSNMAQAMYVPQFIVDFYEKKGPESSGLFEIDGVIYDAVNMSSLTDGFFLSSDASFNNIVKRLVDILPRRVESDPETGKIKYSAQHGMMRLELHGNDIVALLERNRIVAYFMYNDYAYALSPILKSRTKTSGGSASTSIFTPSSTFTTTTTTPTSTSTTTSTRPFVITSTPTSLQSIAVPRIEQYRPRPEFPDVVVPLNVKLDSRNRSYIVKMEIDDPALYVKMEDVILYKRPYLVEKEEEDKPEATVHLNKPSYQVQKTAPAVTVPSPFVPRGPTFAQLPPPPIPTPQPPPPSTPAPSESLADKGTQLHILKSV
jgi:hypothetical protein